MMSQDIRQFFTRKATGTTGGKKPLEHSNKGKKRQRKYVLSDSDSEEEPNPKLSKNDKGQKNNTVNKTTPKKSPKKSPKSPIKSPVKMKQEVAKVSIAEMLGMKPVKRTLAAHQKTEAEDKDLSAVFDDDKDFEEALSMIDEDSSFGTKPNFSKLKGKNYEDEKKKNEESHLSTTKDLCLSNDEPHKKKLKLDKIKTDSANGEKEKEQAESNISCKKEAVKKVSESPKKLKKNTPKKGKSYEEIFSSENLEPSKEIGSIGLPKKKEPKTETFVSGKEQVSNTHKEKNNHKEGSKPVKISPQHKAVQDKRVENVKSSGTIFELWVDKYKPTTLKQIIGQQGEKSNVNKLVKWLRDWHKNQDGSKKLTKPSPWAKDDSGAYYKTALLSGPPGVGKTTTAHLVCKELGMDMVEFNASDTRSKKLLSAEVSELLSSKSLSPFFQGGEVSKQHVLVMDEVDGMAGNEDRGGVQELIQLIKMSKVPIICMCNDRNHPKIRSLANYCFDLRFYKPRVDQIKGAMMSICFKEKLKIKPETLVDLISNTNQDIRLVLNHLSMLAAKHGSDLAAVSKHIKLGPWDVLKKVFSEEDHKSMSIYDKSDLFFHDYSVAPLFVHENYLNVVPHSKEASTKHGKMKLFAKAASSLCTGDLMESAIRSNNAWSLLPVQAIFSSLIPGEVLEGHVGGQINFPAWFGKNSRRSKLDRLTQEIQSHTRLRLSGSKSAVNLDYAKPLRNHILQPLLSEGSEGVQSALSVLHNYNLLREDIESLTELNNWLGSKDPMSSLDSKVKAAFTRAYNKAPVLAPFSMAPPVKKGRGGGGSEEWEEEESEEKDDNEDDITNDGMIMAKKKTEKVKKEKLTEPSTSKGKGKRGKK